MTDHRHITGTGFHRRQMPEKPVDDVDLASLTRPLSAKAMPASAAIGVNGQNLTEKQMTMIQRRTRRVP